MKVYAGKTDYWMNPDPLSSCVQASMEYFHWSYKSNIAQIYHSLRKYCCSGYRIHGVNGKRMHESLIADFR